MAAHTEELADVYGAKSPEEARAIYNQWSDSYDADNLSRGFRLPALGAGLLARHLGADAGPILDACCGTGLVGETLGLLGYNQLTGCDISPDMLAAAGKTGCYGDLRETDLGQPLSFEPHSFAGFVCVGAFGPGHAPPVSLEHLVQVTKPGGFGVFNLIEASYEAQGFPEVMDRLSAAGTWRIVHVTRPFLPFLLAEPDLWSRAYVIEVVG